MIEIKSHKQFLDEMLNNLKYTEDKSPNSFSYDNLSAVAVIAEDFNTSIHLLSQMFDVENLESDDLERHVYQWSGLTRNKATKAVGEVTITGTPGTIIPQDTVFMAGDIRYLIDKGYMIPETGELNIKITAEETGPYGNISIGMVNRTQRNIIGVATISNQLEIDNGYGTETDDELRERYYYKLQNPPKAGNPSHYKMWAEEVDGIGEAKVFRTWDGPSTVKVVIIGRDRTGVDEEMVQRVHDHIMKEAPIHWENLTVESATEVPLNLKLKLSIRNGYSIEAVKENIRESIENYLYSISFRQSFISYAKIGGAILQSQGVLDYDDLLINDVMDNIALQDTQVGVIGTLEVIE